MTIHLETIRFILRDFEYSDIDDLFELDSNPDVMKYIRLPTATSKEQIEKTIAGVKEQYQRNGIGRWIVQDKATKEVLGWSGLKIEEHFRDFHYNDVGYRFKPQYWGKGVATETALASLKYGFEQLSWDKICATADIENIASNIVLQKIGLTKQYDFDHEGEVLNWYEIQRSH